MSAEEERAAVIRDLGFVYEQTRLQLAQAALYAEVRIEGGETLDRIKAMAAGGRIVWSAAHQLAEENRRYDSEVGSDVAPYLTNEAGSHLPVKP